MRAAPPPADPRRHPGRAKTDCQVVDFGIWTIPHGTLEQQVNLDTKLAAVAQRAEGNGTPAKACPGCGAEVPPAAVECPLCGERLIDEVAKLVNFELVEVDLFDRSNFAWTDVSAGQDGALRGGDRLRILGRGSPPWPALGGHCGLQPKDGQRSASVSAAGDRSVCLARADDGVNEPESAEMAHRSQAWTKHPPTEKQMAYLPVLASRRGLTRHAASCHPARRFNRKLIDAAFPKATMGEVRQVISAQIQKIAEEVSKNQGDLAAMERIEAVAARDGDGDGDGDDNKELGESLERLAGQGDRDATAILAGIDGPSQKDFVRLFEAAVAIDPGTKRAPTCSIASRCSTTGNDAMVTLATSARLTSKSGQPDLFELSTETGQDQLAEDGLKTLHRFIDD